MKSKRLIWAFLLTAIGLIMPTSLFADSFTDENGNVINYDFYEEDNETWITGLASVSEDAEKAGHLVIPSTYQDTNGNTHAINAIGWSAFNGNTNVYTVEIADDVCAISGYAFQGCTSLTSITLGRYMDCIYNNAFQGCTALTDIYCNAIYPPTLGENALSGCETLLSEGTLHVPEGYADAYAAASAWNQISNIVADLPVPSTPTDRFRVNGMLFKTLTQNTVQVGSGMTPAIPFDAEGSVTIPSTVSYSGKTYTVTEIGAYAFAELDVNALQIHIPSTITAIGNYAFNWSYITDIYCDATTPPTLGNNIVDSEYSRNITLHVSDEDAYADSVWGQYFSFPIYVDGIPYKILRAEDGYFYAQIGTGSGSVLPSNFTGAFRIPRTVEIPASRVNIVSGGEEPILNAPRSGHFKMTRPDKLGKIEGSVSTLKRKIDARIKEKKENKSAKTKGLSLDRFYKVKANTRSVDDEETITFTVVAVGTRAFYGLTGLTKVTLPNSIEGIGYEAFAGCENLAEVYSLADNPPALNVEYNEGEGGPKKAPKKEKGDEDTSPFDGISENCVLYVPEGSIDNYEYYGWGQFFTSIEEVEEIEDPEVGDIIKVSLTDDLKLKCIITSIEDGYRTISLGTGNYDKIAIDTTYVGALNIPATFTYSGATYTVTSIAPYAFARSRITAIDLPETVMSIGEGAFGECYSLSEITGAENIINIGNYAFYGCSELTSIFIPKNVTSIGDYAFQGCTKLREVIMEERPKQDMSGLTQQTYDGWTSTNHDHPSTSSHTWTIDVNAGDVLSVDYTVSSESGWDYLIVTINGTEVITASGEQSSVYAQTMNESGTVVVVASYSKDDSASNGEDQAIINNIGINIVDGSGLFLGSNNGYALFSDCPLDSVFIGRDINYQSGGGKGDPVSPFSYNTSLRSVVFTSHETQITPYEFAGCQNLQHIVLGEGITSVGDYAFRDCYNLQTIQCLAETPPTLGYDVMPNNISDFCTLIVDDEDAYASSAWGIYFPAPIYVDGIPYKILSAYDGNYYVQIGMGKESVLPANFTGEFAIPRTVEIPISKIPTMDEGGGEIEPAEPILNAPSLRKNAAGKIEEPVKTKGLPLNRFNKVRAKENRDGEETITFTVVVVGAKAFNNCTGLTKITLPRNIEQIGYSAFAGCSSMTEFYSFAEQPPYLVMGNGEYEGGGELNKGKDGEDGEESPFDDIADNCVLFVPEDFSQAYYDYSWDQYFAEIREMEGIEIEDPQPGDVIKVLADEGVKVRYIITNNEEGNRMVAVGTGNSSRLAVDADYDGALTIPKTFTYSGEEYTVTEVAPYAFYNCGLSAIDLPESVMSIGESAFYGCTSLSEVTGAEGLISINPYAFYNCSALTSIFIPKTTSTIGDYAFYGCTSLSQVVMEDGIVKEISEENQQRFENWTSTNHNNSSSSSYTWTIEANPGDVLSFDYMVSSESNYDILNVTVNGTNVVSVSGEVSDTYVQTIGTSGTITVYARYSKDSSASYGSDEASVFNIGLNLVAGGGLSLGSNGGNPLFASCPLDSVYVGRDISYSTNSNKGYSPFYNNQSLRSIVFSSQETQITAREFYYCSNLQNIVLGEGITSIGTYAFYNCNNLHNIQCLSETPASLQSNAFPSDIANYCTLTVENENAYVFSDWATYFPFSFYVDGIPYRVYGRDENNNITVQMGTGSGAILAESAEGEFEIPQTIEYVTSDSTLTFPVVAIADSAFYNLSNLTKVTIPATIQQIGAKSFAGCSGLTEFYTNAKVPPTINTNTANATFQGITSDCVLIVPDSCAAAYESSNWGRYFADIIEDRGENAGLRVGDIVTIENENGIKVKYIITSLEEGNCAVSLGTGNQNKPAINAEYAGALTVPETITYYDQTFTVNAVANYALYNTKISEIDIPEHVTSVGNYAFSGCTELTNVTGGENITTIGQYAFYNTKLTKAFIPDNVETIGNYAFQNISTLKEVVFGPKVQSISRYIFSNSTNIEKVVFNGIYTGIPSSILSGYTSLKEVVLGDQITNIGSEAFYNDYNLVHINLPEGLTSIGQNAFYNCDSLRTITIPDNVTNLSTYAFRSCNNLQSVHIGTGVTTISSYSFEGCSVLNQLTGCENVTSIEQYAFANCKGLTSLNFEKVTTIGEDAFYYCSGLTSFECDNITSIGQYAFAYCSSLTSFDCHDKVTILRQYSFAYCSKLKELKGLKAVTNVESYALSQDYDLAELEMGENFIYWSNQSSSTSSSYNLKLLSITLPGQTIPFKSSNSYYGLPTSMILFVPDTLVETYKSNEYTSRFRILPIGSTDERLIATENGGELQEKLLAAGLDPASVLNLTVSGPINGTDIDYIHRYLINLRTLDLENAQIVNGGDSYHQWTIATNGDATQYGSNSYNTENNIVGTRMFAYMTSLQRIVLPKDVTKIYSYAFSDCPQLTDVIIPDSVQSIGGYAFSYERNSSYNNKIASLTLPSQLKQINTYTFRNMDYLQSIVIPDSVTSIGQYAFYDCDALRTVTMGNKVTSIATYAFNSCNNLRSINLSEALDTLGTYVFTSCANLTEPITIPATLRTIPEQAFYGCQKLKGVIFNEGLVTIKNSAFYNCDALTEITLPETLNEIQNSSFSSCDALTKVTMPTTMKTIGESAFNSCKKLADVTMPETLNSMGTSVFAGCTSLPSITLPETITYIPDYTFQGCTSLTAPELSSQTRRISAYVFDGCTSLTSFDFDKYPQLNQLYGYSFQNTGFTEIDIPDRIDTLFVGAFKGCKSLQRAKMPTGVDYVASYLFQDCTALTEVEMHDGINRINSYAFSGCTKLPSIDLNDGITIIGERAFYQCDSLVIEALPTNLETINSYAFYHCDKLDLTTLPAGLKTISSYAFGYCPKLQLESLPAGLTTLNSYAFEYSGIKKMTLPEGITTWGTYIFYECDSLRQVTWPADKADIPSCTFYGCQNLQNPELPNTITTINSSAFAYCNFSEFTFPTSLQTIGSSAFSYSGLVEIDLPISLKSIGNEAFSNSRLRSIEIPDSVTTLGSSAFYNCDSLRTATLGRNMNYSGNSYFNYFNYCDNLQTLRIYAGTPPGISSSYVSSYYKKCVLEVPEGADSIYLATNIWKDFKEIRTFLTGDQLDSLDFAIMKIIYRELDGGNWTNKWDLSSDELFVGKWYGVTTKDGHIVKINLTGNNLRGELPDSLFLLPELTSLDMGNSYITGDLTTLLPDEFLNEKIVRIQLYANELEGDAYPFVSKFPNLTYLSLAYNRLTAMSQPYPKTNISSNGFWLTNQFMDYKTHEPVVTEKYPTQEITLGVPFTVEWNSLQLYDHGNQNYNRNTNYMQRVYWNSDNSLDFGSSEYTYFYKKDDGTYDLRARVFRLPKNTPIAFYPYSSYYSGSEYLDTPSIFTLDWIDGDINADLSIDVTDLQKVIYYALNDAAPSSTFYNFTSADGNSDNAIDVRDAVICVNRILDFDEVQAPAGIRALYSKERNEANNHFAIENGVVRIANGDEVAAIQLTLSNALAEDITLSPALSGFRMAKKQIGNNVRVVIYSMTEQTLPQGEWDVVKGLGAESSIMNVRLSDIETNHLDASIRESVTSIDYVDLFGSDVQVYDLSGRKINKPQKGGVYIINGKKTIIK